MSLLVERYNLKLEKERVSDYHINIFFSEEDGWYIADIPDLKFCSAFGASPEEALSELEIAKKAWLRNSPPDGQTDFCDGNCGKSFGRKNRLRAVPFFLPS